MRVAVVVDSRNVFHQVGDVCGQRCTPSVAGVRKALLRYGMEAEHVHVGLALPRARDKQALLSAAVANEAYQTAVVAEGGEVLLGELHRKPDGTVEEKMVDVACAVRVTAYVEEIRSKQSDVGAVVVFSKDSNLAPAYQHAERNGVNVVTAAVDVVHHRPHPYLLIGPHAIAEMCPSLGLSTGHEIRERVCLALDGMTRLPWEVVHVGRSQVTLRQANSSMMGVMPSSYRPPKVGAVIELYPVDVAWQDRVLGSFPVLVLGPKPPKDRTWRSATVCARPAPLGVLVSMGGGTRHAAYPMGGIAAGDTVLVRVPELRLVGPLSSATRPYDPDTPTSVRILQMLPKGGALGWHADGRRGLITTKQTFAPGVSVPVVQVNINSRWPVWAAIGSPVPA